MSHRLICGPSLRCLWLWQEPSSIEKVAEVDTHIGVAMSGLTADARTLIEHARVETQVPARRGLVQLCSPVLITVQLIQTCAHAVARLHACSGFCS